MTIVEQNPYPHGDDEVMTNFDHSIDQAVAERLKVAEVSATYSAMNFNAQVWWDRDAETYRCEVWRFHVPIDVTSGSLEDIMVAVSDTYGHD